ncbi:hypothetical protein HQ346_16900 [Rhodococcus sp. BP-252]|uniref:hypothetical protein n=1 Tax=unclassified Rhodococcus (in: high G+C Gram-positive bacteria) TaxID=192944 RepID=UPI001C9B51FA|nr:MULTISPECIES: hypothetical protein [unclassified Rhodococcus (in: high G+C Gram-positive bacteria)]MBY6413375.1 hypothetical protein [Rhodococcus sp. BP-320]MBY6418021.1 hypothetical protein [Rhodococcus sp. BP-321]MBY6422289.1 hypothetical protein [Rhodococcus sp. BP-324]MBY6428070.1 hypothetical protein [Rhodococcus sp. BP-323]MBY6433296.1 hypothetical protein [Rhodococcus sp. BP-322]
MTTLRVLTAAAAASAVLLSAACGSADDTDTPQGSVSAPDLSAAPADLQWRTVAGVSIPVSSVDGPTTTTGTVRSGYSKTPQGAVLAAINGQTALAVAGDRAWPEVVNTVTAPGPGRDEFAAARAGVTVSGDVPSGTAPAFVGFKVTDYQSDPLSAAVSIAQRVGGEDGGLYSYPVALQWIADDWRIVLPTAEENVDAAELSNLDGYTALEKTS